MTIVEMAKLYYPRLWSTERLNKLLELGRLTQEEYDEIISDGVAEANRQ